MFTLAIQEDWQAFESVDNILHDSLSETQGPRYDKKTDFNGLPAALATPSPNHRYFKVPFGNRVIEVDYITDGLSPDDLEAADNMLRSIMFTQGTDVEQNRVERCGFL
jgi:hypothetical protein